MKNNEICLATIENNSFDIIHIKKQNNKICMNAVKKDGLLLWYVKNKTPEICLAAVKQNSFAFLCVEKQNLEISLEAVRNNYFMLKYVNKTNKQSCELLPVIYPAKKQYLSDARGYLNDCSEWDPLFTEQLAEKEGLSLSLNHWRIIFLFRKHYSEYQVNPSLQFIRNKLRMTLANDEKHNYFFSLFLNTNMAGKYAGLPEPYPYF